MAAEQQRARDRRLAAGEPVRGGRRIEEGEAEIVRRIFGEFAVGSELRMMTERAQETFSALRPEHEAMMRELLQTTDYNRVYRLKQKHPGRFIGNWMETGELLEVEYDNFGINIENERARLFRISEPPERVFVNSAVIHTSYQYETNKLWRRNETLLVTMVDNDTLEGELISEYVLDGVPVAKAAYKVTCRRQG